MLIHLNSSDTQSRISVSLPLSPRSPPWPVAGAPADGDHNERHGKADAVICSGQPPPTSILKSLPRRLLQQQMAPIRRTCSSSGLLVDVLELSAERGAVLKAIHTAGLLQIVQSMEE